MKKYAVVIGAFLSFSAFAQEKIEIKDPVVNIDSRADELHSTDVRRIQERIRIGFTIDAAGVVEIVGLAATGSSFNSDWATVLSNGSKDKIELAFRNIYLRKTVGKFTAEAGALAPVTTVGAAGLAPSGWIDGVRLKAITKIGDFKITAGSLGSFKEPNAFNRKFDANFIEIEFDKVLFDKIMTQTAVESFNGSTYIREDIKVDIKVLGSKVFKLFADALYDVERNAMNYEIGTEFDVLKNIINKYDNRVGLKLYYSNINANIPSRSDQISAFYTYGGRFTAQLGGKIDKGGNINWYTRAAIGKANRYDVGVNIKIPIKKSH